MTLCAHHVSRAENVDQFEVRMIFDESSKWEAFCFKGLLRENICVKKITKQFTLETV